MTAENLYQQRYCAFVDILGFRQLIADLRKKPEGVNALRLALATIYYPSPKGAEVFTDDDLASDFRAQSISDAVAISALPTSKGLQQVFLSLKALSMHLLSHGHFIRGAIVKGRLHHDDKMVFGEALVQAYDLETKVVQYPRIMILSDVAADAKKYWLTAFLKQADDGPYFLHVLRDIHDEIVAFPPVLHETYYDLKKIIERKFAESITTRTILKRFNGSQNIGTKAYLPMQPVFASLVLVCDPFGERRIAIPRDQQLSHPWKAQRPALSPRYPCYSPITGDVMQQTPHRG